jgi:hypothetical protein
MTEHQSEADLPGAPRTVRQWLADMNFELYEPTEETLRDLDTVMGYDEFWQWSSGKADPVDDRKSSWRETIVIWCAVGAVLLSVVWLSNL